MLAAAPAGGILASRRAAADFVARLRAGHPRLILLDEDLPRVREVVAGEPAAAFPGTARVTARDRQSGAASLYLVRFLPQA